MGSNGGDSLSISTVDISPFTHVVLAADSLSRRKKAALALAECCYRNGWAGITGHGVLVELLERAFDASKRLFDLPLEDKQKAPHPEGMTPYRGYSGLGREQGGGAAKGGEDTDGGGQGIKKEGVLNRFDYKESYEIGSEANREHYNIWLLESVLPDFRNFTT